MPFDFNEYKNAQKKAYELIEHFNVTTLPVPVIEIAQNLSIEVIPFDLGNKASGILVIENGKGKIGYNPADNKARQRFTIAHELGHYQLHMKKNQHEAIFIDRDFLVKYRNQKNYTAHEFAQEQQANAFAAALLMPEHFVRAELDKEIYENMDESDTISNLAKVFHVSNVAMTYRLTNLNITI